jgi:hypothetical protein
MKARFSTDELPLTHSHTHTHTTILEPFANVHSLYLHQQQMDPKIKLCICKAILNGIRKADYVADTLSVEDSQNLLFLTIYMLQFHNINIIYLKKWDSPGKNGKKGNPSLKFKSS